MGGGARTAVAPLEDGEPSELLGLRLPQPVVEPAAGDAGTGRGDALDGPPAGPVAAQPPGRDRPARPQRAQPHATAASRPGSAGRRRPPPAPPNRPARTTPRPVSAATPSASPGRSTPATPSSGAGPTCCSCSPSPPPARCSSPPRRRSQPMIWVSVASIVALLGYVCLLGQLRQRELLEPPAAGRAARRPDPCPPTPAGTWPTARRSRAARSRPARSPPAARRTAGRTPSERGTTASADAGPAGTLLVRRGAVAQLVERNNRTVEARGSIPLSSTRLRSLALAPFGWSFAPPCSPLRGRSDATEACPAGSAQARLAGPLGAPVTAAEEALEAGGAHVGARSHRSGRESSHHAIWARIVSNLSTIRARSVSNPSRDAATTRFKSSSTHPGATTARGTGRTPMSVVAE